MIMLITSWLCIISCVFTTRYCGYFSFLLLVFSSVFSYGLTTDYFTYAWTFNSIDLYDGLEFTWLYKGMEFSFYFISYLFKFLGFNSHSVFVFYVLVSYTFVYLTIRQFIPSQKTNEALLICSLFLLVLHYTTGITVIRQVLAAAIVSYALTRYNYTGSVVCYFLWVILAAFFHYSAVIFFPFFVLCKINLNIRKLIIYFFVTLIICFLIPFELIANILPPPIDKFSKYFLGTGTSSAQRLYSAGLTTFLFGFMTVIAYRSKQLLSDKIIGLIALMAFMTIFLRVVALNVSSLNRLSVYFVFFLPLFFYWFLYSKLTINSKAIFLVALLGLVSLRSYAVISISNGINNYESVIFNFCVIGDPCPITIYGDSSEEVFRSFGF